MCAVKDGCHDGFLHEYGCFDAELFYAFELDLCKSAIGQAVEFFGEFFFEGLYGFLHVVDGHFGAVYGCDAEECVIISCQNVNFFVVEVIDEVVEVHVWSFLKGLVDYIATGCGRRCL
jgi:hypothetical protein